MGKHSVRKMGKEGKENKKNDPASRPFTFLFYIYCIE